MDYIKKNDMQENCIYFCNARNFNFGIWHEGQMYGVRHKWGDTYLDSEYHWDDGAENCGTCKPYVQLTDSIEDRIHPSFFDCRNWRGQGVLHDILYPFEQLIVKNLKNIPENLEI